jgi:hypothetical protein
MNKRSNLDEKFSYFTQIGKSKKQKPDKEVSLYDIAEIVVKGPLEGKTLLYRDALKSFGKDHPTTKGLKKKLPLFKVFGLFTGLNKSDYVEGTFTKMCPFDIDVQDNKELSKEQWDDLYVTICSSPYVVMCMRSPSNGLKGLIAVDMEHESAKKTEDTIKNSVYPVFSKLWGVKLDAGQATFHMGMFLAHDPEAHFAVESIPFVPDQSVIPETLGNNEYSAENYAMKRFQSIVNQLKSLENGQVFPMTQSLTPQIAKMVKGGAIKLPKDVVKESLVSAILQAPGCSDPKKARKDLESMFDIAYRDYDPITLDNVQSDEFLKWLAFQIRVNAWSETLPYVMVGNDYFEKVNGELLYRKKETISTSHPGVRGLFQDIPKYTSFIFEPDFINPQQYIQVGEGIFWNTFKPLDHTPAKGKYETTMKLINHLFGAWERERDQVDLFLDWFQELLTNPKQKLIVPILVSASHGSGKSMLLEWLQEVLGKSAAPINPEDLGAQFNLFISDKILLHIDEMPSTNRDKHFYAIVKRVTTLAKMKVNPKNQNEYMVDFHGHLIATSNELDDVMNIQKDDRRIWIREVPPFPEHQVDPDFKKKLIAEIPAFLDFILKREPVHPRVGSLRFARDVFRTHRLDSVKERSKGTLYHHIKEHYQGIFETEWGGDYMIIQKNEVKEMLADTYKRSWTTIDIEKVFEDHFGATYQTHREEGNRKSRKGWKITRETVGADPTEIQGQKGYEINSPNLLKL